MELCWLETLIVLAESNSMRTAAARLGISPATASERIAALEDALGIKLLVRSSRGSELSEAGRLYVNSARQIVKNWDNILSLVQNMDTSPFQQLSLGLPDRLIVPVLGRFLDSFMAEHPNIELNLYSDMEISMAESLKDHKTDIIFSFDPQTGSRSRMCVRAIHHTAMSILVPADHRLAFRSSVSLKELDGETFLLYPDSHNSSIRDIQKTMLKRSGIRYIEYGGHFSPSLYILAVKMGCGIAMVPRALSRSTPPKTVFIDLEDDYCKCDIYMIYDPNNANPALQMFLEEFGDQEGEDEK